MTRSTVLIYEDKIHELILRKILRYVDYGIANIEKNYKPRGGKSYIDKNLRKFLEAARHKNIIVLRDLDDDAECAPGFLESNQVGAREGFCYRLAVREAEMWLVADAENFSRYFGISESQISRRIYEGSRHPKRAMLELIYRGSKPQSFKKKYVTNNAGQFRQSTSYNTEMAEFIEYWSIDIARQNSQSLQRAIDAIESLKAV